jgi:c(7)-type cytochrome triheme protein
VSARARRTVVAATLLGTLALVATALTQTAPGDAPGDLRFEHPPGSPVAPAIFQHWVHRLRFTCNACHPAVFSMTESEPTTMDAITAGQACGVCHNGRVAFAVSPTTCNRCHVPAAP